MDKPQQCASPRRLPQLTASLDGRGAFADYYDDYDEMEEHELQDGRGAFADYYDDYDETEEHELQHDRQHELQDDRQDDRQRSSCSSHVVPPHVMWLASMPECWALWTQGLTVPSDDLRCTGACSWHSAGDGYSGDLDVVVGKYNTIHNESALNGLFTSLEVTLFRADRQMWTELQQVVMDKHRSGAIVILNGKPDKNKWLHITCVQCGRFVFVPYSIRGWSRQGAEGLARGRQKLFEFFMLPYRAQESELRREV